MKRVAPPARAPVKAGRSVSASSARPGGVRGGHSRVVSKQDSLASIASSAASDAKDCNIKVVVRCRGLNKREQATQSESPISTQLTRGTDVCLNTQPKESASFAAPSLGPSLSPLPEQPSKTFTYDHVFGPDADQGMLYEDVITPILQDVLAGYQSTVFAYGQTGTGKTHTMQGDLTPSPLGSFSPEAGIIPRTLHRLFHLLDGHEFGIRVSYIELYNEELRDLNAGPLPPPTGGDQPITSSFQSSSQSDDLPVPLKIFDDSSRKGVVIQGLEETHILSAAQGIKVLTQGAQRRQIAATKCNENSSRSHTIFTITVHIKETSSKGEDLLKVGKFNLVDLAGSENVGRSGAEKGRAREAGMINQSLLTLGRVINALVERSPHVPYRESKLTRLLQDSLGGRTKTCIIATISPAAENLEETMSTLEYALRAKSISTRPELNQRMTKAALLSQYASEIERLKADLMAAREKNGIFLSAESWNDLSTEHESRRAALVEAKRESDMITSSLRTTKEEFEQALRILGTKESELCAVYMQLEEEKGAYIGISKELVLTKEDLDDQTKLREAHQQSRKVWKDVAKGAIVDADGLHAKIARSAAVRDANDMVLSNAENNITEQSDALSHRLSSFGLVQQRFTESLRATCDDFVQRQSQLLDHGRATSLASLSNLQERSSSLKDSFVKQQQVGEATHQQLQQSTQQLNAILQEKAALSSTIATEVSSQLVQSIDQIVEETLARIEALATTVTHTNTDLLSRLSAFIPLFVTASQTSQSILENENARLKAQNTHLLSIVESQRSTAAKWKQSFMKNMEEQLDEFLITQDEQLEKRIDALRADLESANLERVQMVQRSAEQVESLKTGQLEAIELVKTGCLSVEEHRSTGTDHIQRFAENSQEFVASTSSRQQAASTELVQAINLGLQQVQQSIATAHESANETTIDSWQETEQCIASTSNTLKTLQSDLKQSRLSLKSFQDLSSSSITSYATTATEFLSSTDTTLRETLNSLSTTFVSGLSSDLPTGKTPKKRTWPSTEPDHLDASPSKTLEHLRGPRTLEELPTPPAQPIESSEKAAPRPSYLHAGTKIFETRRGALALGDKSNIAAGRMSSLKR